MRRVDVVSGEHLPEMHLGAVSAWDVEAQCVQPRSPDLDQHRLEGLLPARKILETLHDEVLAGKHDPTL